MVVQGLQMEKLYKSSTIVSRKHQLYLANNMTTTEGYPNSMFVYKGNVVKEGVSVTPAEIEATILTALPPQFNDVTVFYKTDKVEIVWSV